MTARSPLWFNSGNLQEMTAAEIVQWQVAAIFVYASSPTSVLTINTGSAGNLAAISDTRRSAGAVSTNASAFVAEASTAEPGTVTVSYDRVHQAYTTSGVGQTTDGGQISYPVYKDASHNIVAMNLADFKDTFIEPAIDLLVAGSESNNTGGTYTISSANSLSGYQLVSGTPVFTDTRANVSAYSAAGIPETLDQPTTITSYYLHRRNGADSTPSRNLLLIDGSANLIEGATATMKTLIGNWIRYDTANTSGQKILYTMATSGGNTRGSGIVDTRLNGSGNYQTLQSYGTAYRSQEFPNGSAATIATYALRIAKGG